MWWNQTPFFTGKDEIGAIFYDPFINGSLTVLEGYPSKFEVYYGDYIYEKYNINHTQRIYADNVGYNDIKYSFPLMKKDLIALITMG